MSLETKDVIAAVKRRPVLFACAAVSLLLALLVYFRLDEPNLLQTRLEERERELTRLSNNVKFSAQLDAQLETLRAANEKIAAGALRAGELARNQQVFFQLEAATGVKLLDLRQQALPVPPKGAAPGIYVGIPFTLTIEGDYPQLIDFLHRLDRVPALSRLTSATVSPPAEGAQKISLSVELLGTRS